MGAATLSAEVGGLELLEAAVCWGLTAGIPVELGSPGKAMESVASMFRARRRRRMSLPVLLGGILL